MKTLKESLKSLTTVNNISFRCFCRIVVFTIFFWNFFTFIAFCGTNYYEVESPYKMALQKNYDMEEEEHNAEKLDLSKVHRQYLQRRDNLLVSEAKETDTKDIQKKEKEEKGDRKQIEGNKDLPDDTKQNTALKQAEEKAKEKSWIDDWVVKTDKVPHDIVGAYTSLKLALTIPLNIKSFSATETTRLGDIQRKTNLFSGSSDIGFMPAFYISVGNDRWKWFRWEFEVGYIPFRATKLKYQSSTEMQNYTFYITKQQLSLHIFTGGVNAYLQMQFFDNKIVGFIGCGVALGYAWSWDRNLSGDFLLPVVKGMLGFSMLVRDKAKLTISYNLSYMTADIPSKYKFARSKDGVVQEPGAIYNGSLKFGDIIIQGIQFEYQFYV